MAFQNQLLDTGRLFPPRTPNVLQRLTLFVCSQPRTRMLKGTNDGWPNAGRCPLTSGLLGQLCAGLPCGDLGGAANQKSLRSNASGLSWRGHGQAGVEGDRNRPESPGSKVTQTGTGSREPASRIPLGEEDHIATYGFVAEHRLFDTSTTAASTPSEKAESDRRSGASRLAPPYIRDAAASGARKSIDPRIASPS